MEGFLRAIGVQNWCQREHRGRAELEGDLGEESSTSKVKQLSESYSSQSEIFENTNLQYFARGWINCCFADNEAEVLRCRLQKDRELALLLLTAKPFIEAIGIGNWIQRTH